jgi:hypothetical protein
VRWIDATWLARESLGVPLLRNPRHELFAQAVASGKSASEAYRQSGAAGKNADVHSARMMVNDGICKRAAELKAAQSQKSELSSDQLREFLVAVIQTPAGKVDEQSRLCQSYKNTSEARQIRMPDKLRAVEQLVKLCGWNEPEKFEHGANNELTDLLKRLRGGSPG